MGSMDRTQAQCADLSGVYVSTITIFKDTQKQEIDIEASQKHILHLRETGLKGALILGSVGEYDGLTREERKELIRSVCTVLWPPPSQRHSHDFAKGSVVPSYLYSTQKDTIHMTTEEEDQSVQESITTETQVLHSYRGPFQGGVPSNSHNFHNYIMAGVGGQTVQDSITSARDAYDAGARYAAAYPPTFNATNMSASGSYSNKALESYYIELANQSPIPVLIYAITGVNIEFDTVQRLASHRNIVGIIQTDHNVENIQPEVGNFHVLTGTSDHLIGDAATGINGIMTGMTNFIPRTFVHLYDTLNRSRCEEAKELQGRVSAAESVIREMGIVQGIKVTTRHFRGYGGIPRRPLPPASLETANRIEALQFEHDPVSRARAA